MSIVHWMLLFFLAFSWATSFTAIEMGLTEISPLSVMFWRITPAAIFTIVIVYITGLRFPRDIRFWGFCCLTGIFAVALPFVLIAIGQQYIEAGLSSILNASTPIFTAILAHYFLQNERLHPTKIIGLILGVSGIAIIFGLDSLKSFDLRSLGQFFILGASLSYGIGLMIGKTIINTVKDKNNNKIHPLVICSTTLICAAVILFPFVYLIEGLPQPAQTSGVWFSLMFMSLIGTGTAFMIFYYLLSKVDATNVSIVTFLIPPIAIFVGWIVLDEVLTSNMYIGMGVIFLGLVLLNYKIKKLV